MIRAAHLLQARSGHRGGARLHVVKRVPIAGGMGGGSADAAAALLACSALWETGHTRAELAELRRDPALAFAAAPLALNSMAWMLEAAELDAGGAAGALRGGGLLGVWLATLRAWEADGSADLGPTMAALDRALDRAEQAARSIGLGPADHAAKGLAGDTTAVVPT